MAYFRMVLLALVACLTPLWPHGAQAASAEDVVLTVSVPGENTTYTLPDLESLGAETFSTTTIWTEGTQTFTGVPLRALLEAHGVSSGTMFASAINDYTIEIPVADAMETGPIIAYHMNGAPMSVRSKGPLWIVYPYDSSPDFQSEVVYSRSIWQLDRIEFRE